jgi:hypothetical protein
MQRVLYVSFRDAWNEIQLMRIDSKENIKMTMVR